jgi:TRAP transporter 4TM/12TM fusion protein
MKRVGFPPHIAAAVETAASLGGQLMPPVMGAAAFLMVAITGIPYNEIIKAAAIPACMYFASVYASVHFIACKMNIQGIPIHGSYWRKLLTTLKKGLPFILPVTLLFTLLLMGYSAHYSALISIASLVVVGCLKREKRLGLRSILKALEMGAKSSLIVSAACACVGFGVGVVGLTGVGVKFSSFIVSGSGGSIFLTVLLVGIAALIVGIELPIAAAYLVLAVLAAPALQAIGLPVMVSHLIIMWFSIDAAVTPPVAITAFVAAGIAGAGPFKTSFSAWNMAKGIYLIPFMMVYTPITLNGPLWEILFATMAGTIGLVAAAAGMHGWLIYRTSWFHRSLLILIAAGTITPWLIPRIIGIVVFAVLAAYQWLHRPSHKEMTIVEPTIVDVDLRIKEVKLAIDVRKIEID